MKKSELIKVIREELKGYSPQIGQTKGLTPDTLTKILTKIAKGEEDEVEEGMMFTKDKLVSLLPKGPELEYLLPDLVKTLNAFYANHHLDMKVLEEEKPGLWANIRAKRARGEKPAHKNSNAHKDAVKAGKKINAMSEGQDWPEEHPSRHGDMTFRLQKVMPDGAAYEILDVENDNRVMGRMVFKSPNSLQAFALDYIKPQGGRQSTHLGEDKSDAIRWFGNLKYYYSKAFVELRGEDRETYRQMAKDYFSKL